MVGFYKPMLDRKMQRSPMWNVDLLLPGGADRQQIAGADGLWVGPGTHVLHPGALVKALDLGGE